MSLECRNLTCKLGQHLAVNNLSFSVKEGEMFALLGPNGAGKTTTFSVLTTLRIPTSGQVRVAGLDVVSQAPQVRRSIGVVFQEPALDDRLTAGENLEIHASLYGLYGASAQQAQVEALDWAGLSEVARRPVRTYSGGQKRRLEVARALMHHPRILFLDEPTLGLDTQARHNLWEKIASLRQQGLTVFLTTHHLQEAEGCDRVAILDQGKLVALGSPTELKTQVGKPQSSLEEVFLELTGRKLRDEEATPRDRMLGFARRGGEHTR